MIIDGMPRILVLRTAGTNCDEETAHAFRLAGATAETVHAGALLRGERSLDGFDGLAIPGGFSHGDDLGAGTVLANQLRAGLRGPIEEFVASGRLVIGICNGFQVLVRLGLLPGWGGERAASLVVNRSGKFEDRWVNLRVETANCPFLCGTADEAGAGNTGGLRAGACIRMPVAHKEGRFVMRDDAALERLRAAGQIALTYADLRGRGTEDYPANPNGSAMGIAGITNLEGNVLGLMPHPERFLSYFHDPRWTRRDGDVPEDAERAGDGYVLFANAVAFLRKRAGKSAS